MLFELFGYCVNSSIKATVMSLAITEAALQFSSNVPVPLCSAVSVIHLTEINGTSDNRQVWAMPAVSISTLKGTYLFIIACRLFR